MYRATRKAGTIVAPWLSPMMKVEVAEPGKEDADQRGRTRTKTRSRAEMLPKNLISKDGASEACSPERLCTQSL
jgi:hypothetical protein